MNILLVSPHSDDIALSMNDFIDQHLVGHTLSLATVFSSTTYANGEFGDMKYVSNLRNEEDKAFVNSKYGLINAYISFDFEDACVRFPGDWNIMDLLSLKHETTTFLGEIKDNMDTLVKDFEIEGIFIPCAFGHKDHYLVREVFRSLTVKKQPKFAYYSDFPYWTSLKAEERYYKMSKHIGDMVSLEVIPEDPKKKIEVLSKYPSQIDSAMLEVISMNRKEEIWSKSPFWEIK